MKTIMKSRRMNESTNSPIKIETIDGKVMTLGDVVDFEGEEDNGNLYHIDKTTGQRFFNRDIVNISGGDSCRKIMGVAFYYSKNLIDVSVSGVKSIGQYAIARCPKLKSVNLPNAIDIGNSAFCDNHSLTNVELPNAEIIGGSCFAGCESLNQISLPYVGEVGPQAFRDCSQIKKIGLPNAVVIGTEAFSYCQSLNELNLQYAEEIGEDAFVGCDQLKKLTLYALTKDDIKNIADYWSLPHGVLIKCKDCEFTS